MNTDPPPGASATEVGGPELHPASGCSRSASEGRPTGNPAGELGAPIPLEARIAAYVYLTRHDDRYSDDAIAHGVLDLVAWENE
jgi:hypothetical protein